MPKCSSFFPSLYYYQRYTCTCSNVECKHVNNYTLHALFKENLSFEFFLSTMPRNAYIPMIKFRTSNFKLPIETGRWSNVSIHERKCNLCATNDLGNKFHYLLTCPFFENDRKELLEPYYFIRPNIIKYKELLTSRNKMVLIKLSKFMNIFITLKPISVK